MAKTLGEKRKQKSASHFIGRSEHLKIFKSNMTTDEPLNIFNIHGLGGVGKTFLSRQYIKIADEHKCLSVYTDEDIKSVLQWMETVAEQFKDKKAELTEFDKRYKVYLQETKKLESDPEKPKGTFAGFMKTVTKGLIKEAKKLPGADLVGEFIDEDSVGSAVGEWGEFVRKKLTNKDEVELILEPLNVLSPLFWKGVLKQAEDVPFVCFFIDTFEETDAVLEKWLLEVLDEKHGDIPSNILIVIAGRDALNPNRWSGLSDLTHTISLEPFTQIEAEMFLTSHGIVDPLIQSDIIALSGHLPVLMDALAVAAKLSDGKVEDKCETAVERFLKWTADDKKQIVLNAALPRKLNQDIVEQLIPDKTQVTAFFDWISGQPYVLRRGTFWAYHNVVRDQMLRYVRTRSPKEWVKQHRLLAAYYESVQNELELDDKENFEHPTWLAFEQERLYHALCAKPDANIPVVLASVVKKWQSNNFSESGVFGETLFDAGTDNDHIQVKGWGLRIRTCIQEFKTENYIPLQQFIEDILQKGIFKADETIAFLHYLNGTKKEYDHAIECYEKAVAIKPDYHEVYYYMGNAYSAKGDKGKAIECYEKAVAIKPDYHSAYYNMGNAYSAKGDKDKAIECYEKAITIKPDYHSAYNNMSIAYSVKGDKDKAIEYYEKAIAVKPDYHSAYNNMGNAYSAKGDKGKAIECYEKAIKIKPDYHEAYYNVGIACYDKGDNEKAIEAFEKAIAIKPDYHEAYYSMGFALIKFGDIKKAEIPLQKAVELGSLADGNMNLGHVYLCKGDKDKAIAYYKTGLSHFESKDDFWEGMQDDFQYLTQYGITEEYYQSVLDEVKRADG